MSGGMDEILAGVLGTGGFVMPFSIQQELVFGMKIAHKGTSPCERENHKVL